MECAMSEQSNLQDEIQRLLSDRTRNWSRADYREFLVWLGEEASSREEALDGDGETES